MPSASNLAHRGLPFANPMSEPAVDRALDAVAEARRRAAERLPGRERDGGPEALAYARRIRDRRALPDGTRTLGFALLLLRAGA